MTLEVVVLCVEVKETIYIIRLAHLLEDTHVLLLSTIPQQLLLITRTTLSYSLHSNFHSFFYAVRRTTNRSTSMKSTSLSSATPTHRESLKDANGKLVRINHVDQATQIFKGFVKKRRMMMILVLLYLYEESQLRKKEAAAAGAQSMKNKRNSSSSTRRATTSTQRVAAAAAIRGDDSSAVASGRSRKAVEKRKTTRSCVSIPPYAT